MPSVLKDKGLASTTSRDKRRSDIFPMIDAAAEWEPRRARPAGGNRARGESDQTAPPERVAKGLDRSQTAQECGDAADRTRDPRYARWDFFFFFLGQRTREVCITHSRAMGYAYGK